jgi:hypothetical protein
MSDYDLELAAEEEIERACDMQWRELSRVMPWGDAYEGFTPAGAAAHFERSYLWAEQPGGDILCEVAVYPDPQSYERAARRSRLIRKG